MAGTILFYWMNHNGGLEGQKDRAEAKVKLERLERFLTFRSEVCFDFEFSEKSLLFPHFMS